MHVTDLSMTFEMLQRAVLWVKHLFSECKEVCNRGAEKITEAGFNSCAVQPGRSYPLYLVDIVYFLLFSSSFFSLPRISVRKTQIICARIL